jgi:hypothetical protein
MNLTRRNALWAAFICISILATFHSVILSEYAFTDDYMAVTFHKLVGPWDFKTLYAILGRPITSILSGYAYQSVDSIGDMSYLRAFSVTMLAGCGVGTFLILRSCRFADTTAGLIAAVLTLNPATGVYAGWAIAFPYPLSIFLSLLGGWLFMRCLEDWRWSMATGAFLSLLTSFFIYQPTALTCVVLFVACYFAPGSGFSTKPARNWLLAIVFTSFTMSLYFVLYKCYIPFIPTDGFPTSRVGFVSDIPARLAFYSKDTLWNSTIWWGFYSPKWVGWLIVSAIGTFAVFLFSIHYREKRLLSASMLTGLLFASLLLVSAPVLLPRDTDAQLRVYYPIMGIVGTVWALGLGYIFDRLRRSVALRLTLLVILSLSVLTYYYVDRGIVRPHSKEVKGYKDYITKEISEVPEFLFFIHPVMPPAVLNELPYVHEYGQYSSWLPWIPYSLVNILLWEKFPELKKEHQIVEVIQLYPWQKRSLPSDAILIDGYEIFQGTPSLHYCAYSKNMLSGLVPNPTVDPLFGEVQVLNDGWHYSERFGFYKTLEEDPTWFLNYGTFTIETIDSPEGDLLMTSEDGERYITSAERFPEVYDEQSQTPLSL